MNYLIAKPDSILYFIIFFNQLNIIESKNRIYYEYIYQKIIISNL